MVKKVDKKIKRNHYKRKSFNW